MSRHTNKTKADATARIMLSKVGSCVEPTEEYLDALERELHKWLDAVKEIHWKVRTHSQR